MRLPRAPLQVGRCVHDRWGLGVSELLGPRGLVWLLVSSPGPRSRTGKAAAGANLVPVALVHAQGLGAEAVPHAEAAHQVGQVDGPDAPGEPQLLQGPFELSVVQLAQVPAGTVPAEPRGSLPPRARRVSLCPREAPPCIMNS